jgi:hypothetical protein
MNIDVESYWADGYTVVRNVFTASEVEDLRARALHLREYTGELLGRDEVAHVVYEPRLIEIARTLLGDTPVYFGNSSIKFGFTGRGYHKDNADRHDQAAPDWRSRYTLLRMAIYLQDHRHRSGGLNVRRRSHLYATADKGWTHYTASGPGDVVIWNLRTSHGASGAILRMAPWLPVTPWLVRHIPEALIAPEEKERIALFITYGLDDIHLERYIRYIRTRKYVVDQWRDRRVSSETMERLQAAPLIWRDAWAEIADASDLGVNETHIDLPYTD